MLISGIQKFTMLDYPGKTSCIVFTAGCNFRCGYCHNPEFVLPEKLKELKDSFIPEDIFFNFLKKRKGLLKGVVISGGEPTIMPDLKDFIIKIKDLGFLVKLDTNGNKPDILENLLIKNLLDYVAMDIKTSLLNYKDLCGDLAIPENIQKSINLLKSSGIDFEFRTTLLREIHTVKVLDNMGELFRGAKRLYLQQFRPTNTLKKEFGSYKSFDEEEMAKIREKFSKFAEIVEIRN